MLLQKQHPPHTILARSGQYCLSPSSNKVTVSTMEFMPQRLLPFQRMVVIHGKKTLIKKKIRPHLVECLKIGKLPPFPTITGEVVRCDTATSNIELYCLCRVPYAPPTDERYEMAQCNQCKEQFIESTKRYLLSHLKTYEKNEIISQESPSQMFLVISSPLLSQIYPFSLQV